MADVKISALPGALSAASTNELPMSEGGTTYKVTVAQMAASMASTGLTASAGSITANLSTGVAGGQSVVGGTAASNSLTLSSTSNAVKGKILFGTSAYDEANNWLGIGIASPTVTGQFGTTSNLHSSNNTILLVGKDQNAPTNLSISNSTAGTAASVGLLLNSSNRSTAFYDLSTSYTTFAEFSGQTLIEPDNTTNHGLVISIPHNGSTIRFYGGGRTSTNRHFTYFSGTGNFLLQSGGSHTDAGYRLDVNGTARVQARLTVSQDTTVATQTSAVITTDTANCSLVLRPTGTGAIIAAAPDGTATSGNARGNYAVDLQMVRGAATRVASGQYSAILSGENSTASGTNAVVCGGGGNIASANYAFIGGGATNTASAVRAVVVGGEQNSNSGLYAFVGGGYLNNISSGDNTVISGGRENIVVAENASISGGRYGRSYLFGQRANAPLSFTAQAGVGDAQTSTITYFRSITGQAATELFLNGSNLRAILALPTGATQARAWRAQVDVVAIVSTVGNGTVTLGDCFMGSYHVGIKRIGANTSLVGAVSVTNEVNDAGMAGAAVTITADDTNEALKIEFTPATNAGSTTVTRVVATAYLTEVGY